MVQTEVVWQHRDSPRSQRKYVWRCRKPKASVWYGSAARCKCVVKPRISCKVVFVCIALARFRKAPLGKEKRARRNDLRAAFLARALEFFSRRMSTLIQPNAADETSVRSVWILSCGFIPYTYERSYVRVCKTADKMSVTTLIQTSRLHCIVGFCKRLSRM